MRTVGKVFWRQIGYCLLYLAVAGFGIQEGFVDRHLKVIPRSRWYVDGNAAMLVGGAWVLFGLGMFVATVVRISKSDGPDYD